MRILWDALEKLDLGAFALQERIDRLRGLPPLMDRTKETTKNVRSPQRVIEFEK